MTNFRDGQEDESGTIRRDPAGLRGRRDDSRTGEEAWSAPTNGAPSDRQCDSDGAKEARTETSETGSGQRGNRPDARERPASAAQAAAHGAPHLDPAARGATWPSDRRAHRAAIRTATETRARTVRPGSIRAAELRLGPKKVRSTGLKRWRNWMEKLAPCSFSRCAVWRRATHFIGPTRTPRSKRCWRPTNSPSITLAA